jgi:hypothetical protein
MTLTSIESVISGDRRELDLVDFVKKANLIKSSKEFQRIVNNAAIAGMNEGMFAPDAVKTVETLMVIALWTGYRVKEQEIGAAELEAFFGDEAIDERVKVHS